MDINKQGFTDVKNILTRGDTFNGYIQVVPGEDHPMDALKLDRKDTANKPLPLLMPYEALVAYSDISDVGNAKYGERESWKNSTNGVAVYANAAARHLFKLLQGEEIDPETGLPHYKAVVWNAAAVAWHYENKKK